MTLDEAIARLNDEHKHEFVLEPGQLEEWLTELKEAKRLLKAAVEDINAMLTERFGHICEFCKHFDNSEAECRKPINGSGSWCCKHGDWRHEVEVLKLIGEGGDPGD